MCVQNPIRAVLDAKRENLIDPTARNRLVHTQRSTSRSSRLEIDGKSEEVFRILVRERKSMTFLPARTPDEVEEEQEESGQRQLMEQPREDEEAENVVAAENRDDQLSTRLTFEVLHKRLLKLHTDARTLQEEQGANVLYLALGFLEWYENENSEIKRQGPLLLIPVVLERRLVRHKFVFSIRYTEDEIFTNLSLQQKLRERDVALPEVPDLADLSPTQYFESVEEALSLQPRWKVLTDDIVLWFFSFSKYLMWRDLGSDAWPVGRKIEDHVLIRALLGEGFRQEPSLFHDDEYIDDKLQPLDMVHVLDADSSQTTAIEEVRRGRNLIIQGPPGTGKSQTIANLIAAAVKDGKTVLFLAEKQAALEVVKRYLDNIRLGKMCLELHSKKANRRAVKQELQQTLQLDRPPVGNMAHQAANLKEHRDRLNRHVSAIHKVHEPSRFTPYRVIGELVRLQSQGISHVDFELDAPTTWSPETFSDKEDALRNLAVPLEQIGNPQTHVWRGVETEVIFPARIGLLTTKLQQVIPRLNELIRATERLTALLNMPPQATAADVDSLTHFADRLAAAPPMDRLALDDSIWDEHRQRIERLVRVGLDFKQSRSRLKGIVIEDAWTTDVSIARRELAAHGRSWFRMFCRGYRESRDFLRGILVGSPSRPLALAIPILDALIVGQNARRILDNDAVQQIGQRAFGNLWMGGESDWQALSAIANWEAETRAANAPESFRSILARLEDSSVAVSLTSEIATGLSSVLKDIQELFDRVALNIQTAFGVDDLRAIPLAEIKSRLEAWASNGESITQWHAYYQRWRRLADLGMGELGDRVNRGLIGPKMLVDSFKRAYFDVILSDMFRQDLEQEPAQEPRLALFNGDFHNQTREQFKGLDSERIELTRHEVAAAHYRRMKDTPAGFLLGRSRAIRTLFSENAEKIQKIKPVFMMSPISVAQFFEPGKVDFDLLLIDEASQVRPEDALGAIARSKQIVIVGDIKQLPPTTFFDKLLSNDDMNGEESEAVDVDSILELGMMRDMPSSMLRWHYRSRHHSLIAVSNHEFYDDRLYIVPHPEKKPTGMGLRFRHVSDGIYDRGGSATNQREAQVVADAVMEYAGAYPGKTLGVGAFSISQRNAIVDELELRRRSEPRLEQFFSPSRPDPFFVKNLENIQGDERDVIFISVGYGKDQDGRMTMNFGPLSGEKGERRLNVLISRARERCEVFSSITADDINLARVTGDGPRAFKTFLKYAQTGHLDIATAPRSDYDSEFERAVCKAITKHGYEVHPQVGVAGFFIDLGVVDPSKPGRYLLGVECDGASYHSARSARDRDRLRQEVLERREWIIHRIWSTDWFKQPEEQLQRTLSAIENAKVEWATRDSPPTVTSTPEDTEPPENIDFQYSETPTTNNHLVKEGDAPQSPPPTPTDAFVSEEERKAIFAVFDEYKDGERLIEWKFEGLNLRQPRLHEILEAMVQEGSMERWDEPDATRYSRV